MVKLAVRKSDGSKWAVKVIEKTSLSQEDEEALKTEVNILQVGHCASCSTEKRRSLARSIVRFRYKYGKRQVIDGHRLNVWC